MNLTPEQIKVFDAYKNVDDGAGFHFAALAKRTGLKRDEIRAAAHHLASLGLLEFMRGCMTEDGEMYGSAYVLTPEGHASLAKKMEARR